MSYELLIDSQQVKEYCQQAATKPAIAVDTEFVRTRTLYPQLGLIQLYDGERLVLVDPIAVDDLQPVAELLTNPDVVKILHSCSEDLEAFQVALNVMPSPIFDSQFAAGIVEIGSMLGYAKLVETMLGIEVDKGESRTDWLARPLSPKQLDYAAKDVLYLFQLYPQLKQQVEDKDRLSWVYEEMEQLCNKKRAVLPNELAYLNIKNAWQLQGQSLSTLQALAAWRMRVAQERNIALNFVVKEHNLLALAKRKPSAKSSLYAIEDLHPQDIRKFGDDIIEVIESCANTEETLPLVNVERLVDMAQYKSISQQVRKLCVGAAEDLNIPVELLGSKKQINQLLSWYWFKQDELKARGLKPDLLQGWRATYLADAILDVLDPSVSA
ncbi:ribonuclease D [Alteromonadaceae bacterium BrNp21-10]|nr:ribonuclease D [Alteromonadaceae bacterium BrNp21-10]